MTLFDYTNSMREQGCVKVVLIFPCMVNVVLLRYTDSFTKNPDGSM